MAKTAVVNKRRKKKSTKKRRRRNYGAAAANPKRRRRRRNPAPSSITRRRNSPRKRNPDMFDFDRLMDTVPGATGGLWAARWATNMAGPFEPNKDGVPEPGIKHAFAILLAANYGSEMIGSVLGSSAKGEYARIGALAWGGDLFLRKRFMRDSEWVSKNLNLEGVDDDDEWEYEEEAPADGVGGFQDTSALGQSDVNTFQDAAGNTHVMTTQGWKLSGEIGVDDYMVSPDGTLFKLAGAGMGAAQYPRDYGTIMEQMSGFQSQSALGMRPATSNTNNSFGYAA